MDKSDSEIRKEPPFVRELHCKYLEELDKTRDADAIGFYTNEHLKLPGGYWCVGALSLLDKLYWDRKQEIVAFVKACQCPETGGFGGNLGHDPHITTSLYALLIVAMFDAKEEINLEKLADFISSLQNEDGSFSGDYAGEVDARFSYCAVSTLTLLNKLEKINVEKAIEFILKCQNIDGAFGGMPGAESHAAYVFCCVGALKMIGAEHLINTDKLGLWLSRRQTPTGGFNGRPEKLPDVCYSWWILSSCFMIQREEWINLDKLKEYILNCQDQETGGVGDRPGNEVDVFHTFFGLSALSLMGHYDLVAIDNTYAIPEGVIRKHFPHIYSGK